MPMTSRTLLGTKLTHASVRQVDIDAPTRWLAAAWSDFRKAPTASLAYGAAFVIVSYVIVLGLHNLGLGSVVPAAMAGFFLIAPVLAVGLYEVSRRLERGEPANFEDTLFAFRRNLPGLATMGLVLMLAMAVWMQVALLIFMMFFHASPPPLDNFLFGILTSDMAVPFVVIGGAVGYVIASIVFAITAVSIPMLLDRNVPVMVAITTSVAAVRDNWRVMLGWAATIVVLIGVGFLTAVIGLALTLPLVAYGTWHAYRDLVE
jgi:uncharacterized membrane protein